VSLASGLRLARMRSSGCSTARMARGWTAAALSSLVASEILFDRVRENSDVVLVDVKP